ncbi:hypothetical protein TCE0_029r07876 [Talaromyces pinophilus]|uniref:Uncharacterized protein n=1 Tax=Talaromyces pinophilus TaxID=128442 RepID=A0A0B8MXV6_TALPI|nr:hypothetical protein TCE0_029r07876 [Talaromyces pinophilus]
MVINKQQRLQSGSGPAEVHDGDYSDEPKNSSNSDFERICKNPLEKAFLDKKHIEKLLASGIFVIILETADIIIFVDLSPLVRNDQLKMVEVGRCYWTVERNWRLVKLRRSGLHWESLQSQFPGQSRADLAFQYDCVADTYDEGMMNQCAYLYQECKSVLWREIASRIGCTPDKAEGMIVGVNQFELARRAVSFELAQMNEPIQNVSTITNSLPAAFGRLQGCVATPFVVQLSLVARFRSQRKAALWIHGQMCTGSQNFRPFRAVIATSQSTSELLRNGGVAYGSRTEALLQSRVRNAIVTKKEAFFARRTLALVALALFEASFHDDQNCAAFTDPLNVGSGLGGDLIP